VARAPELDPAARGTTPLLIAAWLLLLCAIAALSLRGWGSFQVGIYQDDAVYSVMARSIATGGPYGQVTDPESPRPAKYPFAFPLLLAPVVALYPAEPVAATVVSLLATLANVSLLFWGWPWLSPTTSRWWGFAVAALYGISPLAIGHTRMVMSEPVFLTFTLAALILTERCAARPSGAAAPSLLLGIMVTGAVFTRFVGAALAVAVVLRIGLAAGRWAPGILVRAGTAGIGALALVLLLTPVDLNGMAPARYFRELDGILEQPSIAAEDSSRLDLLLFVTRGYVIEDVRRILIPAGGGKRGRALAERLELPILAEGVGVAVAVVVFAGLWRVVRTSALAPSVIVFQLIYFAGLLFWPWHGGRYLYPIQPFLFVEFLAGLGALVGISTRLSIAGIALRRRGAGVAMAAGWLGLVAVLLWKSWALEGTGPYTRDLRIGAAWLRDHSPPEAVVMARYPEAILLYSGRITVDPVEVGRDLDRVVAKRPVDFVLVGPMLAWNSDGALAYDVYTAEVLLPWLEEHRARGSASVVYESAPRDLVRVYRIEASRGGLAESTPRSGNAGKRRSHLAPSPG
jgi:hypothetical protein